MTLGQRIQELRKQAGLSQEGLGEALGVSRQAVSKWESDGGIPELDTLIALSKMFGITVGQLLGVEEPREAEAAQPSVNEELVEAVLRRYAEESRRPEEPQTQAKYPIGSWIVAGCAVVLAVVVLTVSIGKVRGVFSTVSNLQSQISTLQSDLNSVSSQMNNISNNISNDLRQQVEQALEEGNRLVSTCEYDVVGFDVAAQTVTVRFDATLKEYAAGSRLQFLLDWKQVDGTEGRTLSEEVEGPDFKAVVTLPMNHYLDVTVRVKGDDGSVQEQWVDVIHSGMHPEIFELNLYGGLGASHTFSVTKWTIWGQQTSATSQNSNALNSVRIYSYDADLLWPVTGHYVVVYRGETVLEQDVEFQKVEGDENLFRAEVGQKYFKMEADDEVIITLTVTDNLGRVKEFRQEFRVRNGEMDWPPSEAIVLWPD